MGVFDFLKKKEQKASLPPLPDMSTLPPLPDKPGTPPPEAPQPPASKLPPLEDDAPLFPDIPEEHEKKEVIPEPPKAVPDSEETEKKHLKIKVSPPHEEVPDTVPNLEDLPEPPAFKEGLKEVEPLEMPKAPGIPEHIPKLEGFVGIPAPIHALPEKDHLVLHRVAKGPLFVRMEQYRELLDDVEQMRNEFKQNENIYVRMNDYRTEQDKAFENLHGSLEDVQRKLMYMDKTLFESD